MPYIGTNPIDLQTTVISGAQNTATLPLAQPTAVTAISGAFLQYAGDRYLEGLPDVGGLETQQDYNVWVFEAFNSQHSIVDTTQPSTPVEGELYYDQGQQQLEVYISGNFIDAQTGPFADVNSRLDALTTSVTGEYLPFTGGKISTTSGLAGPRTDGILQVIQGNDGEGGKIEIRSNDGSGNLTTTTKLYSGGGIDMAGILSLNGTGSSATIRAYGHATGVKQLNLATADNTTSATGVSTRLRLASTGVTIFSTDLILDTTGAGTAGIQAKGSSGQDVWSLSSDGQFNTPNTTPLKFNTNNGLSEIVAYNGSNAGLNLSVNTSSIGTGTNTPMLSLDRTGATFNSALSNNFKDITLNNMSVEWFQSTGAHYVFLDTTANSSSQNLSIYSKNIQGASGSTLLFELSHTASAKEVLVYTNSMTFEAEFDNLFFSSGEKPQYITWSSSQPFIIGTGGTGDFNTNYLKLQNTTVNVGTSTQRIDTQTHGFVTLNTPIAANASGNWFKLTGTVGGTENSTVLQAKQNSGSDTNIEYFGSTAGTNSLQTKSSLVGNIEASALNFSKTINYAATTAITFFPPSAAQQFILIGGTINQTLTFKHTGTGQSTSSSGSNMFSISAEGVQVSSGVLSFNGTSGAGQFLKFGTTPSKSFYIAKEDSSGHKYPSFAVNPTNASNGNLVVMPQRTIFGLTGNSSLDTYANTLTTQPQVTIKGLGTNQNLITFEPNSTATARTQYIMFGPSGDSSQFGTYQIARGTRTTDIPSLSTDVFIRFRCPSTGTIQTDFIAPVSMPNSVSSDNPHTRGEFDTVMTALKAAVNSSTDHATLKAALLSALAAY